MKAPPFDYHRPGTLDEALALLARHGEDARPLAGGQSLMPMMNFRLAAPAALVDLNRIDGLGGIALANGHLSVGALARHAAVASSPLVAAHAPLLAAAMPHVAHPAIRNRGTFGGSLALADPAAEIPAVCLALAATIVVAGPAGERRIAADDFFLGIYETALGAGELVVRAEIPISASGDTFAFDEIVRRHGDYAMAGLALSRTGAGVRAAFFGVADRAIRLSAVEALLAAGDVAAAAAAAERDLPADGDLNADAATKRHYAAVLVKRAAATRQAA